MAILELRLDDVVELRKQHPCGNRDWTIIRLGADIGLRCRKCHHRVLIDRIVLERRIKRFVERGPDVVSTSVAPSDRGIEV